MHTNYYQAPVVLKRSAVDTKMCSTRMLENAARSAHAVFQQKCKLFQEQLRKYSHARKAHVWPGFVQTSQGQLEFKHARSPSTITRNLGRFCSKRPGTQRSHAGERCPARVYNYRNISRTPFQNQFKRDCISKPQKSTWVRLQFSQRQRDVKSKRLPSTRPVTSEGTVANCMSTKLVCKKTLLGWSTRAKCKRATNQESTRISVRVSTSQGHTDVKNTRAP
jgi:hypothetical protein